MEILFTRKTRLGVIGLTESNEAIIRVWLPSEITWRNEDSATPLIEKAFQELDDYFAGSRREFSIPVAPVGTPFQRSVWRALSAIPYGQTATYGEIARRIGRPGASRAVGVACGRNPVALFIPCHRVVAATGLGGYRGGLEMKNALLDLERNGMME
jgi:methylated-DNA-[protein]-cysteine S-methyltransferase